MEQDIRWIQRLNNYKKAFDESEPEGNIGNFLVQLYRINLKLKQHNISKTFKYYKTITKKLT